jgi:uncharacterized protein (DUF433 family)
VQSGIAPRIVVDPTVRQGQPVVRGSRILVEDVLDLLAAGQTSDRIRRDAIPDLSDADIQACLAYAAQVIRGEEVHVAPPQAP